MSAQQGGKGGRCLDTCLATLAVVASLALYVTGRQAPPALRDFVAESRGIVLPVDHDRVLGLELLSLATMFTKKAFTA
jgi:histidine ammonia-lyase